MLHFSSARQWNLGCYYADDCEVSCPRQNCTTTSFPTSKAPACGIKHPSGMLSSSRRCNVDILPDYVFLSDNVFLPDYVKRKRLPGLGEACQLACCLGGGPGCFWASSFYVSDFKLSSSHISSPILTWRPGAWRHSITCFIASNTSTIIFWTRSTKNWLFVTFYLSLGKICMWDTK